MTIIKRDNIKPFKTILLVIGILWAIHLIGYVIPGIRQLGIRPRTFLGLIGILTAPLLHAHMAHIIANSGTLFFLGITFLSLEKSRSGYIMIPIYILTGLGTWLIGRSMTNHIGASGVIYGLLGYLLTIGIFKRSATTIILSVIIFIFYRGALWGIYPDNPLVSWEAHLSGFLSGIIVAKAESNMDKT